MSQAIASMNAMAVTTVPKVLREKLGENCAEAMASLINDAIEDSQNGLLQIVEERFARRLAEEIGKFRAEISENMANMRAEFNTKFAGIDTKFAEQKASLLRWMFIFWLTQMAAFLGIVWKVIP